MVTLESMPFNPVLDALKRLHLFTMELKFQAIKKGESARKLVVSSQMLAIMGYNKGDSITENVIGQGKGLIIKKVGVGVARDKIIYQRGYKKGSRTENQLDIRSQQKINAAFQGASRAHIKITKDSILITPVYSVNDFDTKGATIRIPSYTEQVDGIVSVLETIRTHKVTHADLLMDDCFQDTQAFRLLKVQLRREGYAFEELSKSKVRISINKDLMGDRPPLPLIEPQTSQAPPYIDNLTSFVGMSGGIDASILETNGLRVKSGLEIRMQEKRDTSDKTYKYAQCLALNTKMKHLFNEDIYTCDKQEIGRISHGVAHGHYSLTCAHFSTLMTNKHKDKSFDDLSTTRDMIIPLLDLIKFQRPITISIENVPGFLTSDEYKILSTRLTRMGYYIESHIHKASDYGGLTKRKRLYLFASLFPTPLDPMEKKTASITAWDAVKNQGSDDCRLVTHTNSVQKGIECNRIRVLEKDQALSPTVTRKQSQQTKDALYILDGSDYYMPSVKQLRALMGIPESFKMDFLSKELQTEVIGQSVEYTTHDSWIKSIKKHLLKHYKSVQLTLF